MHKRLSLIAVTVFVLLALGFVPDVRSEVAAETDAFGRYVRTTVFTQSALRQVKIWRLIRRGMAGTIHALNPNGDRHGDLFPFVGENPLDGRAPVAVWSRFNGLDYDLVWSRWKLGRWTQIAWVATGFDAGDDVDPVVSFDATGRPYVTWWRDEEGVGTVYVSFFLQTRWSPPILVSDAGSDSRSPRISPIGGAQMRIDYRTPAGHAVRIFTWNGTTTITDDLNPVGQFSVASQN